MKTTVEVPEAEMQQLLIFTRAGTAGEAIVRAIEEFMQRQWLARLMGMLGIFGDFMDAGGLEEMREQG